MTSVVIARVGAAYRRAPSVWFARRTGRRRLAARYWRRTRYVGQRFCGSEVCWYAAMQLTWHPSVAVCSLADRYFSGEGCRSALCCCCPCPGWLDCARTVSVRSALPPAQIRFQLDLMDVVKAHTGGLKDQPKKVRLARGSEEHRLHCGPLRRSRLRFHCEWLVIGTCSPAPVSGHDADVPCDRRGGALPPPFSS